LVDKPFYTGLRFLLTPTLYIAQTPLDTPQPGLTSRSWAKAENIKDAWRARHLAQSEALTAAYAATVQAIAAVLITLNEQVGRLEEQLGEHFHQHPDARYLPVPARNR